MKHSSSADVHTYKRFRGYHEHPKKTSHYVGLRFLGQVIIFMQALFQVNFTVKGWISDSSECTTQ